MKSKYLSVNAIILSCILMIILSSCNLITTDKDRFYVDEDNRLKMIDIEKTGPDIIVPEKVGDNVIRRISLYDRYFSKIDTIDVSNVSELEFFKLNLLDDSNYSKLKMLDFSKNKKLKYLEINKTTSLKKVIFNNNCEDIYLKGTSVKKVDLKKLEKLDDFSYFDGPLEELDISNNPNLEYITIANCNVKSLDVSKNPKLKKITVDEGTKIIGPTNAQIEYNKGTE